MRPIIFIDTDNADLRSRVFIKRLNDIVLAGARVQYLTTQKELFLHSLLPRTNREDVCIYDIPFISLLGNILIDSCEYMKNKFDINSFDFFSKSILITDDIDKAKSAKMFGFKKVIDSEFKNNGNL